MRVNDYFQREDYVLRWPVELFRKRLALLLNGHLDGSIRDGWSDRVELFLSDAFSSEQPAQDFRNAGAQRPVSLDPWATALIPAAAPTIDGPRELLVRMLRQADNFPYELQRRPYRSQRGRDLEEGKPPGISLATAASRFVNLVAELEGRGYFERSFEKDCVDDPATTDPGQLIEGEIGIPGLWPLPADRLATDEELFLDLVEVLGEFVAAPQARYMHSWAGCGWHHSDFNRSIGREVYYWRVNRLLAETPLQLQLAISGEDRGRLVEVSGDARNDLVAQTIEGADPGVRDPIQHAVALFRRRGSTIEDKRSACVALAGVLELRRQQLKDHLFAKDEGALFEIANTFDLRHRTARQKGDYDPAFLDWVFWWYLGTIELTDRIIRRQRTEAGRTG
jgi:hypothetical protein